MGPANHIAGGQHNYSVYWNNYSVYWNNYSVYWKPEMSLIMMELQYMQCDVITYEWYFDLCVYMNVFDRLCALFPQWKIYLRSGDGRTELVVEPSISMEELYQRLLEKSGSGGSMELEQYDKERKDWVEVGAEDIELEDGARFRVSGSSYQPPGVCQ